MGEVRRCNAGCSAGEDSRNGIGQTQNNCNLNLSPFGNRTPRKPPWEAFCIFNHHSTCHFNLSVLSVLSVLVLCDAFVSVLVCSASRPCTTFAYYIESVLQKCPAFGVIIKRRCHWFFGLFLTIHDFLWSSLYCHA